MTEIIKIKKGLNIKLVGEADKSLSAVTAMSFAVKPTDFHGIFPKMLVKIGDEVKAGSPLFFNKYQEKVIFTSPVSGIVAGIKRGEKRLLQEVQISSDGTQKYVEFPKADANNLTREEIIEQLLKSGVWPYIRQRPYSVIANPDDIPREIFISAFNTAPLTADNDFIVNSKDSEFQAGIDALAKLTKGKIHLNIHETETTSKVFLNAKNVQINTFSGPHPAGNIGIQIHHINPINKGDIVWYCSPQSVLIIGRLFLEGKYDAAKIIAISGSEVKSPKYFKVISGTCIKPLVENNITNINPRYISGNVLTGTQIDPFGYLGFYDSEITVIPEGNYFEFVGWAMPRLNKFSVSRSYFSWLFPNKKYRLDTNLNGGQRAFIFTGEYEKVFPMDILPMHLLKAILVNDIDLMEQLGIYEVDEEDFALCEVICPSKTDIQKIIREGLDLIRQEMS